MTIAPLAALSLANTAFSLLRGLMGGASAPTAAAAPRPTPASLWHELGARLDVRAATPAEIAQAAQVLCDAGLITLEECATLCLDPVTVGGGMRTPIQATGRVDWLAEFHTRLQEAQAQGQSLSASRLEAALEVLQRLAAARRGPVHAVA